MATRKPRQEPTDPGYILWKQLRWILPIQKKTGSTFQQYCNISYNWACATNEIITIGTPIEADLNACPHSQTFASALAKCETDLSITQISERKLSVTSGDFKAMVACLPPGKIEIPAPDPCIAYADDRVKHALAACAVCPDDEHQNPVCMAVLLQSMTAVGTNGHILLEYWHGIDLPPGLLIPKDSAKIVGKADKEMSGFGFSQSSVTFWFKDGSFIKTQLYKGEYPNYQILFPSHQLQTVKLHQFFFKGIKAIKDFTIDGNVYFHEGTLQTNVRQNEASTFKIDGLPNGIAFNSKYLVTMSPYMEDVHFGNDRAFVFGKNTRGVIMHVKLTDEQIAEYTLPNNEKQKMDISKICDDDIPF